MLSQRRIKKHLKRLLSITIQVHEYAGSRGYFIPGIFLPWYIWSLLFYPETVLWWLVTALSFMLVSISFIRPRSMLYWIIPCIFLFNNIQIFKLPWPYIKMSYIGSLAVCFAAVFGIYNKQRNEKKHVAFSTDFQLFFVCLFIAALLGVVSNLMPEQTASIEELKIQFRVIPFISQSNHFISMRFLWLWCCGISLYWALIKLIKSKKDIKTLLWSIQWCSLPISFFGIYSYITRTYMIDLYFFERRICSTFSSPAVLADVFTVILIFGVYLFRWSKSWMLKLTLALLMIFQFITIVLSGCRANIIILAGFGLVWLFICVIKKFIRHQWKTVIIILFVASASIIFVFELPKIPFAKHIPVVERINFWKDSIVRKRNVLGTLLEGRKWHWQCGMKMVKSSPVWGIGCGLFEQEYSNFKVRNDLFSIARAHNVPLRFFAEGGIITFFLFLTFLILTIVRLSRSFFRRAKESVPEWSSYLQMISIGLLALFLLSLFSDILLVREECVFFVAVIAACASITYSKFPDFDKNNFLSIRSMWKKAERRTQRAFRLIGWIYLCKTRLSRVLKVIAFVVLFILFIFGLLNAKSRRQVKLKTGQLSYGFYGRVPEGVSRHRWSSMGEHALTELKVNRNIFYFGYRAVNNRMAILGCKLKLYINGVLTTSLPLNSTKERWVYCDMTALKGQHIRIEFITKKAFNPLKEHWFADNYSYGAVITKPMWTNKNPESLMKTKKELLIMRWSESTIRDP